jgi:hypothetical protein
MRTGVLGEEFMEDVEEVKLDMDPVGWAGIEYFEGEE